MAALQPYVPRLQPDVSRLQPYVSAARRLLPPCRLRLGRRRRVRQQQPQRLARRAEGRAPLGGGGGRGSGGGRGGSGRGGGRGGRGWGSTGVGGAGGRGGAVLLLVRRGVRRRRGSGSGRGRGRGRLGGRLVGGRLVGGREAELLQCEPAAEQHVPRRRVEARRHLGQGEEGLG